MARSRAKQPVRKRQLSPPIDLEVTESFLDKIVDGFQESAMMPGGVDIEKQKEGAEDLPPAKRVCAPRSKRAAVANDVASSSTLASGGQIVQHTAIPGAIVPFRTPLGITNAAQPGGSGIRFSELSVLSVNEFKPHLDLSRLKTDGIVRINGALFSGLGCYDLDISASGLHRIFTFPVMDECTSVVSAAKVEKNLLVMIGETLLKDAFDKIKPWFNCDLEQPRNDGWFVEHFCRFSLEGRPHGEVLDKRTKYIIRHALKILGRQTLAYCSTRLAFLAMAHVDLQSPHLRPDWYEWLSAELKAKLLASTKTDRGSLAKFREGWTAVVELMKSNFLSAEARAGSCESTPLLLEACSSFGDIQAKWDAEKGQLVRETEMLKTELSKAQGQAEKNRLETEALKDELTRQQKEWEENSQKLSNEISKLHEDKQRIAGNEDSLLEVNMEEPPETEPPDPEALPYDPPKFTEEAEAPEVLLCFYLFLTDFGS
ncbi:hypothetical protein R1sor_007742 [Riccia sorocarpa]|uniref:Uncharacterized protein n=1 Tax=Riccia sorocarpa TaxID=122646 RepID=A0ABD3HVH8_9MARC